MLEGLGAPPPLGAKVRIPDETGEPSSRLSVTKAFVRQLEAKQFPGEICAVVVVVRARVTSCPPLSGPIRLSAVAVNATPARKPITSHNDLTIESFVRLFTIISYFLLTNLKLRDVLRGPNSADRPISSDQLLFILRSPSLLFALRLHS